VTCTVYTCTCVCRTNERGEGSERGGLRTFCSILIFKISVIFGHFDFGFQFHCFCDSDVDWSVPVFKNAFIVHGSWEIIACIAVRNEDCSQAELI
jgi:hypothetical protein